MSKTKDPETQVKKSKVDAKAKKPRKESFNAADLPDPKSGAPLLEVRDLCVSFPSEDGRVNAVRGVNLKVNRGETLALVGESGSGKSVTSTAVMGLLDESAEISGSVKLHGTELLGRSDAYMSKVRGIQLSMVFQDPLSALTPVYTVGDQIVEALKTHNEKYDDDAAWKRAVELLDMVGIPNPTVRAKAYPHEFSGGMRQRAVIAIAIANNPDLIIADEPTTALDVTIQAQILEVLKVAQRETGAGVIMITHDLGVVAGMADRVAVMYAGRIVETGDVDEIFYNSRMPYTIGLLGSLPRLDAKKDAALATLEGNPPSLLNLPKGCPFAPRCPLVTDKCHGEEPTLKKHGEPGKSGEVHLSACYHADKIAKESLTYLDIYPAPELKTPDTLNLPHADRPEVLRVNDLVKTFPLTKGAVFKGKIVVLGRDTAELNRRARKEVRRDLQIVFQDPMASLDPRLPVYDLIAEPMRHNGYSKEHIDKRITELMTLVGLEPSHANRYARNFSGGQRQRIGIARALALEPSLLVLDEPVSALDVSIQAGVINLLDELRATLSLSYLFVAHDLSVVRHIGDRVAVMYLGKIVEIGDIDEIFEAPAHPYTQALLSAIPIPDPAKERTRSRIILQGDLPSPANPPSGCRFRTRCPKFLTLNEAEQKRCIDKLPDFKHMGDDHEAACHYPERTSVF